MKKFIQFEKVDITNEDIEDYLIEYLHNKSLSIVDGYLVDDKKFVTNITETNDKSKKCKKIEFSIKKDLENSIEFSNHGRYVYSFKGYDEYNKVLKQIKRFFTRVKKPPIYTIDQSYDDIDVTLFLIGGTIDKKTYSKKGEINNLLTELIDVLKKRGYKSSTLRNNDLFVKVKKYPLINLYNTNAGILCDIIRDAYSEKLKSSERNQPLIEWAKKVKELGYKLSLSAYDNGTSIKIY